MNNLEFHEVQLEDEILAVEQLASIIWNEHYNAILGQTQIDYMLNKYLSKEAILEQKITKGYRYFLLSVNGENIGFTGVQEEGKKLFLSKLYIKKEFRGNGYGNQTFSFLENMCKEKGLHTLWLTVNRYNENSIKTYIKKGFKTIRTEVTDIGSGYVMDDYIMEKNVL